jgi:type VI secretion system protein ImpM
MRVGGRDSVGILGKIPAHGDFVRVNASGIAGEALFDWLQVCLDRLHRDGLDLGASPSTFVFPVESAREILLGVLAGSRDKVGRQFPFAVFQSVPVELGAGKIAALLHASATRLDLMQSIVEERNELSPGALSDRVAPLCEPATLDLDGAVATLRSRPVGSLSEPSFMGLSPEQTRNAFATLVDACRPFVGRKPPAKNPTVLECPIGGPESLGFWIELAEQVLSWPHAAPGVLIPNMHGPRFLLTLGPLPASSFTWLRKPEACRAGVLALAENTPSHPAATWPELAQEGTLVEFFASLRPLGIP